MSFTVENGKQNIISLLDVQTICEDKEFFCKPTLSGVYTPLESFL